MSKFFTKLYVVINFARILSLPQQLPKDRICIAFVSLPEKWGWFDISNKQEVEKSEETVAILSEVAKKFLKDTEKFVAIIFFNELFLPLNEECMCQTIVMNTFYNENLIMIENVENTLLPADSNEGVELLAGLPRANEWIKIIPDIYV